MKKRPSVVVNGFRNSIGTAALALGGILSSVIVVRSLSISEYGKLSFYLWLASAVSSLGLLAFPAGLTKVVSQLYGAGEESDAEALIPWVGRILFVVNVMLTALILVVAYVGPSANRILLSLIAIGLLPGAMSRVINSRVLAREQYSITMVASIITSIVIFLGVIVTHLLHVGTAGYEVVLLSGGVVQFLVLFTASRGSVFLTFGGPDVSKYARRLYLDYVVPSTLAVLFDLVVWQRSEIYFLHRFSHYAELGYYSISYTLFATFNLIGAALLNGLFPSASHDFGAGHMELLGHKSETGLRLATFYSLPIAMAGIVVAPSVLNLFYGTHLVAAGPVARVLIIGIVPGALSVAMTLSLSAGGGVWSVVKVGFLLSLANLGLDLLLIPHSAAVGAALANTLTQFGYAVAVLGVAFRKFALKMPWSWVWKCTGIGLLFPFGIPAAMRLAGFDGIPLLAGMLVGCAVYWLVLSRTRLARNGLFV